MGMQSEHETVLQVGRPSFDPPDDGVAVLDRKRKLSGHVGPAHALILRCRHPPAVNEALGPTADRSEQSAYRNLAILARGDFLLAQLRVAELDVPERRRLHRFFLCDFRTGSYMLKALQNLLIARMSEAISGFPLATRMSLRSCGLRPLFHVRTLPLRRACCARRTAGLGAGARVTSRPPPRPPFCSASAMSNQNRLRACLNRCWRASLPRSSAAIFRSTCSATQAIATFPAWRSCDLRLSARPGVIASHCATAVDPATPATKAETSASSANAGASCTILR